MQDILIRILADGLIIPIVLISFYLLVFKIPKDKRLEYYGRIIIAGLTAYLIAKLLGTFFQPLSERPFEVLGTTAKATYLNNPGFPSDHALFVFSLIFAVWFATRKRLIVGMLFGLAILMCIGRVLALVHTPLDVVGGFVIATIGALWYLNEPPKTKKS